ncbi:class I SAM-dependent methyltransferase [Alcanivorax sp.]|uniref:class I SAM-dependent methyltransferase n=1 Tax=Alcanivorax sp. TaxID=1872427 RepID=UPI0025BCAA48|nr:class I SAM-dependent methyltransferase [Alcanivorax sp.]
MSEPRDTSSISFTALYTGHVWTRDGISAPFFRTRGGAFLYGALAPFEYVGRHIVGGNIRTFLLQRHHLIDHRLHQLIDSGVTQVVEIACGLSPRGHRFCEQYPQLTYIETDLPDMARRKQQLLQEHQVLSNHHRVMPINIFADEGELSLAHVLGQLDQSKPVVVITEGLVNYFPLPVISEFWKTLAGALKAFPQGTYLTDNYPLYRGMPFYRTLKVLGNMLGAVSRSQVGFHFHADDEAIDHFKQLDFDDLKIHNPANYYDQLPIPKTRGNPMVRIMEATTGNE